MSVVQGSGSGQKIQILITIFVPHQLAFGAIKNSRKCAGITLYFGFNFFKNFHAAAITLVNYVIKGPDTRKRFRVVLPSKMDFFIHPY